MEETAQRELICQTGLALLETGLVARTWGNVSSRLDKDHFLITPSGLDYHRTRPQDIVRVELSTMTWEGARKPSGERGVHAAAYAQLPEVNFVIHTHQGCASALGLAGFDAMDITPEERAALGGLAKAQYGLPGTKKLKGAVSAALATGAHTVLMSGHGVVICGINQEQAMKRAQLLEDICRRNLCMPQAAPRRISEESVQALLAAVRQEVPDAEVSGGDYAVLWADRGEALRAQLDDMAQMLGPRVLCVEPAAEDVVPALKKRDAVFVRGVGAIVQAADPDDREALCLLTEKSALCALHTAGLGIKAHLSALDAALMHLIYQKKYAKRKG